MDTKSLLGFAMHKLAEQMTYDPSYVGANKITRLDDGTFAAHPLVTYRNPMVTFGWSFMQSRNALIDTAQRTWAGMSATEDTPAAGEFEAAAKFLKRWWLEGQFGDGVKDPDNGNLDFNKLYNNGRLYWTAEHPNDSTRFGIVVIDDVGNQFRLSRRNKADKSLEYTFKINENVPDNAFFQVVDKSQELLKQILD